MSNVLEDLLQLMTFPKKTFIVAMEMFCDEYTKPVIQDDYVLSN